MVSFTVGLPIFALTRDDTVVLTQELPSPLDDRYIGFTVTEIGIAVGENEIKLQHVPMPPKLSENEIRFCIRCGSTDLHRFDYEQNHEHESNRSGIQCLDCDYKIYEIKDV